MTDRKTMEKLKQYLHSVSALTDRQEPTLDDSQLLRIILQQLDNQQINALFYSLRYNPSATRALYSILIQTRQSTGMPEDEAKTAVETLKEEISRNDALSEEFFLVLLRFIDRSRMKDSNVYNAIGMHRTKWYNLRDKKTASIKKAYVHKLAIVLRLDYYEAFYLLNLAGYTFMINSMTDHVVEFCIRNQIYSTPLVDELLVESGEKALFSE